MTAFIASVVVTLAMVGVLVFVAKRRPPGQRLTWGEAFVAAVFVFALLFVAYGVVPHQFLTLADNEFKWRDDKIGIPLGGLKVFGKHLLEPWMDAPYIAFDEGIPLPNGRFIITAQVVRDAIVGLMYGVLVAAQLIGWAWWQKRGKQAPPELETSAFGRPLLRPVSET